MADDKRPGFAKLVNGFFGKKEGQNLADFAAELKTLSDKDKDDLYNGLTDGTLTY